MSNKQNDHYRETVAEARSSHRKHCFYRYGGDRPDCDCENQALKQAIGRAIDILDNDRFTKKSGCTSQDSHLAD